MAAAKHDSPIASAVVILLEPAETKHPLYSTCNSLAILVCVDDDNEMVRDTSTANIDFVLLEK